jgi:hypothetical protein
MQWIPQLAAYRELLRTENPSDTPQPLGTLHLKQHGHPINRVDLARRALRQLKTLPNIKLNGPRDDMKKDKAAVDLIISKTIAASSALCDGFNKGRNNVDVWADVTNTITQAIAAVSTFEVTQARSSTTINEDDEDVHLRLSGPARDALNTWLQEVGYYRYQLAQTSSTFIP